MFGKFLPREDNFFELFNKHADRIVEAAHAFSKLIEFYPDVGLRDKYTADVNQAEKSADRITHEVNRALHKTFITPIHREQIHSLINTMDDVADLIQDSAETMALYDVRTITIEIKRLTDISVKCCERLRHGISLLSSIAQPLNSEAALKTCEEIDQLEQILLVQVFAVGIDVAEKLNLVYRLVEVVFVVLNYLHTYHLLSVDVVALNGF